MNPNGQGMQNGFPQGGGMMPNNGNPYPNQNPNNFGSQNPSQDLPPLQQAPQFNAPQYNNNQPMDNQGYQDMRNQQAQQMLNQVIQNSNTPNQEFKYQEPVKQKKKKGIGEIILIIFIFLIAIGAIVGAVYCYTQYDALNREVSADRDIKVNDAKKEQAEIDNQNYEKKSAKTTREFTGPSNFGALTFEYPKEWNVYIDNDSSTEPSFAAYFSPDYAKPINSANQGLEFKINSASYENQIKQYTHNLISSQAYSQNGLTGTIFSGKLDKKEESKNGVAVVIKINNYSATIMTRDYETYGEEFDKIISTLRSANYK